MIDRYVAINAPQSVLDVFLQPGDLYWGAENTRLRTILGSCVAIAIWHPERHVGGLCHYILPRGGQDARYADQAVQAFLDEMRRVQTKPHDYVAKVFGGANMFATGADEPRPPHVGHGNVKAAYLLLEHAGIPVISADTGGLGYRKLVFELWSGDVWITQQIRPATIGDSG